MVSITNFSSSDVERCYHEFKEDHFGRKLSNKIIVKDRKVSERVGERVSG